VGGEAVVKHFDHVTVVVRDLERAKTFFGLLGFEEDQAVVIAGPHFERYMGIKGIEADHVTLVLANAAPRCEVQLLRYRHPDPLLEPQIERLDRLGYNHVCFAVDDVEAEVARLRAHGFHTRNEIMDFHRRKLVFLVGPEGITVELSQWHRAD
jgi:catechol 2,3-dioxygenase-like lactoylglutathione lyase family enzyme